MILKLSALLIIISSIITLVRNGKYFDISTFNIKIDWGLVFITIGNIIFILNVWRFL